MHLIEINNNYNTYEIAQSEINPKSLNDTIFLHIHNIQGMSKRNKHSYNEKIHSDYI